MIVLGVQQTCAGGCRGGATPPPCSRGRGRGCSQSADNNNEPFHHCWAPPPCAGWGAAPRAWWGASGPSAPRTSSAPWCGPATWHIHTLVSSSACKIVRFHSTRHFTSKLSQKYFEYSTLLYVKSFLANTDGWWMRIQQRLWEFLIPTSSRTSVFVPRVKLHTTDQGLTWTGPSPCCRAGTGRGRWGCGGRGRGRGAGPRPRAGCGHRAVRLAILIKQPRGHTHVIFILCETTMGMNE